MRNGYEQEIDSKKLLEHLLHRLHSGTEEKSESDQDYVLSYGVDIACQILSG